MRGFVLAVLLWSLPQAGYGGSAPMVMVGSGESFYLGIVKLYDAALYAADPADANRILSPDVSKCLHLTYARSLKPGDFIKGALTVLQRQHPPEDLEPVRPYLERFHGAYEQVETGDSYRLCYDAATSTTTLELNGRELISIDSPRFSAYYFGIWLGSDAPLSPSLRMDLLGGGAGQKREDSTNG